MSETHQIKVPDLGAIEDNLTKDPSKDFLSGYIARIQDNLAVAYDMDEDIASILKTSKGERSVAMEELNTNVNGINRLTRQILHENLNTLLGLDTNTFPDEISRRINDEIASVEQLLRYKVAA